MQVRHAAMERYDGRDLGRSPRIAVLVNDALGNFCVATPLLVGLRYRWPGAAVDYYGGQRTAELEEASGLIDERFDASLGVSADEAGAYDLVVNLERGGPWPGLAGRLGGRFVVGPCETERGPLPFSGDERGRLQGDRDWTAPHLVERYPFIGSSFIGEIFYRLAHLEGPLPRYALPDAEPPAEVCGRTLVSLGGSSADKLWPVDRWRAVLGELAEPPILLGAAPAVQRARYHATEAENALVAEGLLRDWRGRLRLPEVVGAARRAEQVLTIDNGILHFAAGWDTPTVGLFRWGIHRLWAPPNPHLVPLAHPDGVAAIPVDQVRTALVDTRRGRA